MLDHLAKRRSVWIALFAIALTLRLAAAWFWQHRLGDERFAMGDSLSYWVLAQSIARGEPYAHYPGGPRMFRTPGYPAILAALMLVFGEEMPVMVARAAGAVFGTATVAAVACLARQLFDAPTALAAAALTAVYPGAISMSVLVLSEAPFGLLMIAHLIAWNAAWRAERRGARLGYALLAGLAGGVGTLVRPSWLLFAPFAGAFAVLFARRRGAMAMIVASMLAAQAAVMSPWWLRNYAITGELVLTTSQVGASLYDGLSPQATGASEMSFQPEFARQQTAADQAAGVPRDARYELRLDRRLRDAAVRWAREHPGRALQLAAVKFVRIWSPLPNAAEFADWRFRLITALGYVPLLVLSLWGAWRFIPRGWPYAACLMPAAYFTLLHMVFVGSIRYREPAMLSMIVLAAAAAVTMVSAGRTVHAPGEAHEPGRA